jgi:hypothetical protein
VDHRDIRVIEGSQQLRLTAKPGVRSGVARERLRKHFERDRTTEVGVATPVNLSHSTATEQAFHYELACYDLARLKTSKNLRNPVKERETLRLGREHALNFRKNGRL